MAKNAEAGIDYFPMNADIIHNPKIKLVVAEFGSKTTWAVLLPLYCKIYREKGYWIDWADEDSKLLFAQDECKIELSVVNEFVTGCIRRSLFNKRVFDLFGVLTSDRIQENYFEATKRRRTVEFIDEFFIKSNNVNIKRENVNIIPLNVNILTKKVTVEKQKERKMEKKKENESEPTGHTRTPDEIKLFSEFNHWVTKNTPRINQLKEPLTIDQYFRLREKIPKETLRSVLTAMQNRGDLLKKYVSAYLTIKNWSNRELSNGNQKNNANEDGRKIVEEGDKWIINSR